MRHCRTSNRWAVYAFALALLLKAAVPMLAAASAQWQGKTLAEVCTVYGVATIALDGADPPQGHDGAASHAGNHCALSGVAAVAMPDAAATAALHAPIAPTAARPVARLVLPRDANAAWVARLGHAPPSFT
jgi:cobalamin synthase